MKPVTGQCVTPLVAAGVGLRGHQDEAWSGWFGLSRAAKGRQNAKDRQIGG